MFREAVIVMGSPGKHDGAVIVPPRAANDNLARSQMRDVSLEACGDVFCNLNASVPMRHQRGTQSSEAFRKNEGGGCFDIICRISRQPGDATGSRGRAKFLRDITWMG